MNNVVSHGATGGNSTMTAPTGPPIENDHGGMLDERGGMDQNRQIDRNQQVNQNQQINQNQQTVQNNADVDEPEVARDVTSEYQAALASVSAPSPFNHEIDYARFRHPGWTPPNFDKGIFGQC